MIRPDVKVENVRMAHARRLVDAASSARPSPVTLTLLHEKGRVLRAWHSVNGRVDAGKTVAPSMELAAKLAAEHGASDVQIIDLEARERFLREVQAPDPAYGMNAFDHRQWAHELRGSQGEGLIFYPKRELFHGLVYVQRTLDFLRTRLTPEAVFLLAVTDRREWWASLVVLTEKGEIARLSTVDDLPSDLHKQVPEGGAEALARALAGQYRKRAHVLLLDREAFEGYARRRWSGMGTLPLAVADPR